MRSRAGARADRRLYIDNDDAATGLKALIFQPLGLRTETDFALFWDFASLFQESEAKQVYRSEAERALFKQGLRACATTPPNRRPRSVLHAQPSTRMQPAASDPLRRLAPRLAGATSGTATRTA